LPENWQKPGFSLFRAKALHSASLRLAERLRRSYNPLPVQFSVKINF